MIQTVHNFAHVTTAMLLWHKQNCELIRGLFCKQEQQIFFFFTRFELWAHKLFVKWSLTTRDRYQESARQHIHMYLEDDTCTHFQ